MLAVAAYLHRGGSAALPYNPGRTSVQCEPVWRARQVQLQKGDVCTTIKHPRETTNREQQPHAYENEHATSHNRKTRTQQTKAQPPTKTRKTTPKPQTSKNNHKTNAQDKGKPQNTTAAKEYENQAVGQTPHSGQPTVLPLMPMIRLMRPNPRRTRKTRTL